MMQVSIRPQAAQDIRESYAWYQVQQSGLGDRYLSAIREKIEKIIRNPLAYRVHKGAIRKAVLSTFPYSIFYTIVDDSIYVLALLHHSISPTRIKNRLD